jgi:hypothetical protein
MCAIINMPVEAETRIFFFYHVFFHTMKPVENVIKILA